MAVMKVNVRNKFTQLILFYLSIICTIFLRLFSFSAYDRQPRTLRYAAAVFIAYARDTNNFLVAFLGLIGAQAMCQLQERGAEEIVEFLVAIRVVLPDAIFTWAIKRR